MEQRFEYSRIAPNERGHFIDDTNSQTEDRTSMGSGLGSLRQTPPIDHNVHLQHEPNISDSKASPADNGRGYHSENGAKETVIGEPIRKTCRVALHAWGWESSYLLIAVACFVAILTLLVDTNGNRQEDWRPKIELNSLVAILGTIFRSSLELIVSEVISQSKWMWLRSNRPLIHLQFFDDASRGPYGASVLWYRIKKISFVQIGCFVTIASYAIGSFIQQAIRNELCSFTVIGANASVPLARGDRVGWTQILRYSAGSYAMNPTTKADLINAIANPNRTRANILQSCSTGNCTFNEPYSTLGFCSQCADTTHLLTESYDTSNYSRLTLPNGQFLQNVSYISMNFSTETGNFQELDLDNAFASVFPGSISNISIMALTSASCIYAGDGSEGHWNCDNNIQTAAGSGWEAINVVATACSIYPCMRTYTAVVNGGILSETLMNVTAAAPLQRSTTSLGAVSLNKPCRSNSSNEDLSGARDIFGNTTDGTFSGILNSKPVQIPLHCLNLITLPYIQGLAELLRATFTGYCTAPSVENSIQLWKSPEQRQRLLCYDNVSVGLGHADAGQGGWWLQGMNYNGNATFDTINTHMDVIANTLTDRLRVENSDASDTNSFVHGDVMQTTVCTRFVWEWLLFPAGLLLLTALFLLITVFWSVIDRGNMPLWKNSVLPLINASTDGLPTTNSQSVRIMEENAKVTSVRLVSNSSERSWKIEAKRAC